MYAIGILEIECNDFKLRPALYIVVFSHFGTCATDDIADDDKKISYFPDEYIVLCESDRVTALLCNLRNKSVCLGVNIKSYL